MWRLMIPLHLICAIIVVMMFLACYLLSVTICIAAFVGMSPFERDERSYIAGWNALARICRGQFE